MKQLEPYWGRRALDFVDAIEASKTSANVISQFERVIGELGFHAYIMAGIPMSGQSLAEVTVANGWPVEWFELYNRERLHVVDPVPKHCFNSLNPFEWKDVAYDRERDQPAHGVMMRARDFGLCDRRLYPWQDACVVAIHGNTQPASFRCRGGGAAMGGTRKNRMGDGSDPRDFGTKCALAYRGSATQADDKQQDGHGCGGHCQSRNPDLNWKFCQ
jgi:hypothetical protein